MTDLPQSLPQPWRPPMGWNSWDSYGTTLTEDELLANARFMAEHLKNAGWDTLVIDIDWYDPTARAHGYNDNAPLILDEYGRQLPDPVRFPSAAGGKGFGRVSLWTRTCPYTAPTTPPRTWPTSTTCASGIRTTTA